MMRLKVLKLVVFLICMIAEDRMILAQEFITPAQDQFNKFTNVANGWCAADATISLLLPDGKTVWLFGDTFIGQKTGDFSISPVNSRLINNSAIIEDNGLLSAYYNGTMSSPSSLIPADGESYFWPEHAIIENDTIKIFALRVTHQNNETPGFDFRIGTTRIANFKYPEMEYIGSTNIQSVTDTTMRFGACVLRSGNYTYIFGVKDTTSGGMTWPLPYLARCKESINEPWEFYAGNGLWTLRCEDSKPVGDRPMSESFYVYEKDKKFYLIMHEIWTVGELYILEADSITGPWKRATSGGKETLFATITPQANLFSYNLFAHPQFQLDGKILISFNVNTTNFSSIYSDTRNYRARFYWLSITDAVAADYPASISLLDCYSSVPIVHPTPMSSKIYFQNATGNLRFRGIDAKSTITVYGVDGRIYLNRVIYCDSDLNINHLPHGILVVKLQGDWGLETQKIINHNP